MDKDGTTKVGGGTHRSTTTTASSSSSYGNEQRQQQQQEQQTVVVIDLVRIAEQMWKFDGYPPIPSLTKAYANLPRSMHHTVTKTTVYRFQRVVVRREACESKIQSSKSKSERKRHDTTTTTTTTTTTRRAQSYIDLLKKHNESMIEDLFSLVCLKNSYAALQTHHVPGSTSFIRICNDNDNNNNSNGNHNETTATTSATTTATASTTTTNDNTKDDEERMSLLLLGDALYQRLCNLRNRCPFARQEFGEDAVKDIFCTKRFDRDDVRFETFLRIWLRELKARSSPPPPAAPPPPTTTTAVVAQQQQLPSCSAFGYNSSGLLREQPQRSRPHQYSFFTEQRRHHQHHHTHPAGTRTMMYPAANHPHLNYKTAGAVAAAHYLAQTLSAAQEQQQGTRNAHQHQDQQYMVSILARNQLQQQQLPQYQRHHHHHQQQLQQYQRYHHHHQQHLQIDRRIRERNGILQRQQQQQQQQQRQQRQQQKVRKTKAQLPPNYPRNRRIPYEDLVRIYEDYWEETTLSIFNPVYDSDDDENDNDDGIGDDYFRSLHGKTDRTIVETATTTSTTQSTSLLPPPKTNLDFCVPVPSHILAQCWDGVPYLRDEEQGVVVPSSGEIKIAANPGRSFQSIPIDVAALLADITPYDVVIPCEDCPSSLVKALHDLKGNRYFLRLISERRSAYSSSPCDDGKRFAIVEKIIQTVAKHKGSFLKASTSSTVAEKRPCQTWRTTDQETNDYIRFRLNHGFPDILGSPQQFFGNRVFRCKAPGTGFASDDTDSTGALVPPPFAPPLSSRRSKVLFDVEHAPKVGLVDGFLEWNNSDQFRKNPRIKLSDYLKTKTPPFVPPIVTAAKTIPDPSTTNDATTTLATTTTTTTAVAETRDTHNNQSTQTGNVGKDQTAFSQAAFSQANGRSESRLPRSTDDEKTETIQERMEDAAAATTNGSQKPKPVAVCSKNVIVIDDDEDEDDDDKPTHPLCTSSAAGATTETQHKKILLVQEAPFKRNLPESALPGRSPPSMAAKRARTSEIIGFEGLEEEIII